MEFPQASVRQRANRVLQLLGVSDTAAHSGIQNPPAAPQPDLLGGMTDDNEPAQSSSNGDAQIQVFLESHTPFTLYNIADLCPHTDLNP